MDDEFNGTQPITDAQHYLFQFLCSSCDVGDIGLMSVTYKGEPRVVVIGSQTGPDGIHTLYPIAILVDPDMLDDLRDSRGITTKEQI